MFVAKMNDSVTGGKPTARSGPGWVRLTAAVLLTAAVWMTAHEAQAQDPLADPDDPRDAVSAPVAEVPPPRALALPRTTAPDSVRTNIWLTEALMSEIVTRASRVLPPPPAAVRLVQSGVTDGDDLLREAMVRVLGGQGYTLFLPDDDEAKQAAVDYLVTFKVVGIELTYPDVGRTLGIWRQWVGRELSVSAQVELSAADSGRILMSDRITRSFADRVADRDFDRVDSGLYEFTTAETSESGWHRRLEEIVVLGTLAGLVAVYFANTAD